MRWCEICIQSEGLSGLNGPCINFSENPVKTDTAGDTLVLHPKIVFFNSELLERPHHFTTHSVYAIPSSARATLLDVVRILQRLQDVDRSPCKWVR